MLEEEGNTQFQKANADAAVRGEYNQNIDRNLEISIMVYSFKKCLEQTLLVPSDCIIMEIDERSIIDPESGDTAVEWDGILLYGLSGQ